MGNSGWCMSKEVEYQTGEAYRSRNSEFLFKKGEIGDNKDKSNESMENSSGKVNKLKLESPATDNEAKQVSYHG
jgi:hypothetical protein